MQKPRGRKSLGVFIRWEHLFFFGIDFLGKSGTIYL